MEETKEAPQQNDAVSVHFPEDADTEIKREMRDLQQQIKELREKDRLKTIEISELQERVCRVRGPAKKFTIVFEQEDNMELFRLIQANLHGTFGDRLKVLRLFVFSAELCVR